MLFLIVFFWTPPHFWALALLIKRDYAAAGIPMLPVVRGERETARSIVLYSFVLVGVTLLPVLGRTLGPVYVVSAAVLGAAFIGLALALQRQTTAARARRLFSYSLAYLALLFVAMALDPLLGLVDDPELNRKNIRLGLLLLAIALVLLAGSVAVAVIYDALG